MNIYSFLGGTEGHSVFLKLCLGRGLGGEGRGGVQVQAGLFLSFYGTSYGGL